MYTGDVIFQLLMIIIGLFWLIGLPVLVIRFIKRRDAQHKQLTDRLDELEKTLAQLSERQKK